MAVNQHKMTYLSLEDKTGVTWVKYPGYVGVNPVNLANLKNCKIYICDVSEQVLITNADDCEIVVGACSTTVSIRNCKNCKFYVATDMIYVVNCDNIKLKLFSKGGLSMEGTTNLTLGYFNAPIPQGFELWTLAKLYPFTTKIQHRFMAVDDRDKETGPNWQMDGERGQEFSGVSELPAISKFGSASNPMTARTLPIGQQIEARFEGKKHWYRGKIAGTPHAFGAKYDVKYDDGDSEKA